MDEGHPLHVQCMNMLLGGECPVHVLYEFLENFAYPTLKWTFYDSNNDLGGYLFDREHR